MFSHVIYWKRVNTKRVYDIGARAKIKKKSKAVRLLDRWTVSGKRLNAATFSQQSDSLINNMPPTQPKPSRRHG